MTRLFEIWTVLAVVFAGVFVAEVLHDLAAERCQQCGRKLVPREWCLMCPRDHQRIALPEGDPRRREMTAR